MNWTPGTPVTLASERYGLRSLTAADVTQRYLDWTADPELMQPLNRPAHGIPRDQLVQYVTSFDNRLRYHLGVFSKASNDHVGVYTIELDSHNRLARINVLIGDRAHWGVDIILETRAAVLDFLFDTLGVEKVWGNPLARNVGALYNYQAQGFRCEGILKAHIRSPEGERLDQYLFALLSEEWRLRARPQTS
jgi:RimJ/RimL family protein N-acetyltransferase